MIMKEQEMERLRQIQYEMKEQNDTMREETKELTQKLDELKDYTQNIDALNIEQLNSLKQRFEHKLKKIATTKEKLF